MIKTGAGFTTGSAGVGCAVADSRTICCDAGATGAGATGAGAAACRCAFGIGGTPFGAEETGAEEVDAAGEPGLFDLKYSTH